MTNRMTEEQAREIVDSNETETRKLIQPTVDYQFAKGYLLALEDERKRAEILVKALEAIERGLFSKRNGDVVARQALSCYLGKEKK